MCWAVAVTPFEHLSKQCMACSCYGWVFVMVGCYTYLVFSFKYKYVALTDLVLIHCTVMKVSHSIHIRDIGIYYSLNFTSRLVPCHLYKQTCCKWVDFEASTTHSNCTCRFLGLGLGLVYPSFP